jgi:hypothetical protein
MPKTLANSIVILVSIVWAGNFVASVLLPGYTTDSTLNFVFMTVVGGALALKRSPGDPPSAIERMAMNVMKHPPPPEPPTEGGSDK